jgi:hypothetical protein
VEIAPSPVLPAVGRTLFHFSQIHLKETAMPSMNVKNVVIWKTHSGKEYTMGRIVTVEDEVHFCPGENTGFNAEDLKNIAAQLENVKEGN